MFPLWFTLLGGFFCVLGHGSIHFVSCIPLFFRCFSLFMIGKVSSSRLSLLSPQDLTSNDLTLKQVCISINASCNEILHLLS